MKERTKKERQRKKDKIKKDKWKKDKQNKYKWKKQREKDDWKKGKGKKERREGLTDQNTIGWSIYETSFERFIKKLIDQSWKIWLIGQKVQVIEIGLWLRGKLRLGLNCCSK